MVTVFHNAELEDLQIIRRRIDRLDEHFVLLLKRRSLLVAQAQETKQHLGLPPRSREREQEILARGEELARQHGLNPDAVIRILENVLQNSLRMMDTRAAPPFNPLIPIDR
jgi:chorismate mutase